MPIYGPEPINLEGVNGHRYWFDELYSYTGVADIDQRLSAFPVAVFLPQNRPAQGAPLVIGLQGVSAPYQYNGFIVPTLTKMGFAVALLETLFAGERSLVRTFTTKPHKEIQPLVERNIPFNTDLFLRMFQRTSVDIARVQEFCSDRYGISSTRLTLFGVSMGVLYTSYAFTADGIGERLLGAIGHSDLHSFVRSWSSEFLPDLAASPLGQLAELFINRTNSELHSVIKLFQLAKEVKYPDKNALACNPMTYIERVKLPRRSRFLVGQTDSVIKFRDAQACAEKFPDGACYVVPGMGHGTNKFGPTFVEHVRYFLNTQLEDWKS
ncbi:MAG TPA: alpha/beta hydrolase [Nostocaceae cyanobacterium]|nr:alpha/beta hydrolase [Nostocaceae cyanobacterium]